MVPLLSRGGIQEGRKIKDFKECHQSLEDGDPDLSLLVVLLWRDVFDFHINSVTWFLNSK